MKLVQSMGGECLYQGTWPQTLFVYTTGRGKNHEEIISALYKRFGRHTQIRFA